MLWLLRKYRNKLKMHYLNSLFDDANEEQHINLLVTADWLCRAKSIINKSDRKWHNPHITLQEGNTVVLEWWSKDKSATLFIDEDEIYVIASQKHTNEMPEYNAQSPQQILCIWNWLGF